jgi:peptidoglycan/LPS O-acetylase OafA/YrhL
VHLNSTLDHQRYEELDSLRGLAAVSVVLFHLLPVIPSFTWLEKLNNTPLFIFWAGHEAVILFFMLSGFVLALPYLNNRASSYKDYLIKRVCRIYIPWLVSFALVIFCMSSFYKIDLTKLSFWFDTDVTPIPIDSLLNHIFLLGEFQSFKFNMVVWSLVHEMRVSLIFPALMYLLIMKYSWKRNIAIALTGSILFFFFYVLCLKLFKYDATKLQTSYLLTLHYIAFFIIGALLAKHRSVFQKWYGKLSQISKVMLAGAGVLSYTYSGWFPKISLSHLFIIKDWTIAIGCTIFMIFCLHSKTVKFIMTFKPVKFVGRISYSLYLYHLIVSLSLVNVLHGKITMGLIIFISFVSSFIVASIMYLVEKKSISLGRTLTKTTSSLSRRSEQQASAGGQA